MEKNWSYYTTVKPLSDKSHHSYEHLNEMGALGWELVSVVPHPYEGVSVFYWKKQIASHGQTLASPTPEQSAEPLLQPVIDQEITRTEPKPVLTPSNPLEVTFDIGDKLPEFELLSTDGTYFSTEQLTKKTVLYFYPADGTEGCTIQAKGFAAVYETMADMDLDIIGISPDNIESHEKFREDEDIPFHLLYDKSSKICSVLGLLQSPPPNEMYPKRTTFLVDTNRKILGLWNDIDVSTHSDDVVSFVLDVLEKAN